MAWIYLVIAGLFEVAFAVSLKMANSGGGWSWRLAFLVSVILSFLFLERALASVPVGTAYAVWTGIGAVGVALVGIVVFKDVTSLPRLAFLALLIVSMIGLKLTSPG
ncbi:MAG: multidrug efflux SMR transporter [Rhodothalassiaceae bacterium]